MPEGPEVMDVSGGVVSVSERSTVQSRVSGVASVLPAWSLARTEKR